MKDKIDIQSLNDSRDVSIDKVGVKNVKYPIIVEDRKNIEQTTIADFDILVFLPKEHRGTHMSRFIEVLNRYRKESLIAKLEDFLLEIKEELNSYKAYTKVEFPYFLEKQAPVSKINSLLSYDCIFEASYSNKFELILTVKVPVTSLCPCSKEISNYGAHNQRSLVSISVKYNKFIWLEEIIEIAESSASCEIYSLLKRVDEKYVTEKAYDNPMFVEDIVREIAIKLKNDDRINWFKIESENFESIHNHNAYAIVTWERD